MEENQLNGPTGVIAIGGSAGSLDVLLKVLPQIETLNSLSLIIILHRRNSDDQMLEELLRIKSGLIVEEIEDKTLLLTGRIYVAPPDYHLLFESDNSFSLDVSEKVNYSRPSIDVAFESAADIYRNKLTAILLSGANADGTEGLKAVKCNKGTVIVQAPETADVPYMPTFALNNLKADHIFSPAEMADFINDLAKQ